MKLFFLINAICLASIACSGRSVNLMTYDQMWSAADTVIIGHVESAQQISKFDAPKSLGDLNSLQCYQLTVKVHCVMKGTKRSEMIFRSYDYLRTGNPAKDFLLDINPPAFLADAQDLRTTDAIWFLRDGEPVTGQIDAHLAVIPLATGYLLPEHLQESVSAATPSSR